MEGISFKQLTNNDIDILVPIAQKAYLQAYTSVWEQNKPEYYIQKAFTRNVFATDLKNENLAYYLIYVAKVLVGFYKLELNSKIGSYKTAEAIQLEKIYILNEFSGKGIGHASLNHIMKLASELRKKVLWVDVMHTSPAKRFYEKMGFNTWSNWDLDYPGLKSDQLKMHRMLKML
ncbi:GNAT family N-acetyltransferase [Spongiivirga sp. MCCC 1A20706]|uniref:GNAT family N-acetyltransferase n=1 Tax=Spongiivirga sp. MCCC 1A20706 TaxID=3160963 RepID=UPI0039777B11